MSSSAWFTPSMRRMRCVRCSIRALALTATLAGALALGACATTGVATPTVQRLTTATYAPTQTVDVLEATPATGFERLANLDVSDPTGTATRGQLVAQLVSAAQKLGANAIVVGAEQRTGDAGVGFNPSGGQMQNAAATGPVTLSAVAIRYTR